MLKVDHIYKTFNPGTINEKTALNGTTLTLNEGDFVTVKVEGNEITFTDAKTSYCKKSF